MVRPGRGSFPACSGRERRMGARGLVIRDGASVAGLRRLGQAEADRCAALRALATAQGLDRSEPGGGGPPCWAGAPVAARRGGAFQCRGFGRAAQPPPAGSVGEAGPGAAGGAAGLGAGRPGPWSGRLGQPSAGRRRGPRRAALTPCRMGRGRRSGGCTAWACRGRRRGPCPPRPAPRRSRARDLEAALEAIPAARPGSTLRLWCEDKAREGQKGRTGRRWFARGGAGTGAFCWPASSLLFGPATTTRLPWRCPKRGR